MSSYTADTLHGLLRELLAPGLVRRRTADQMLFELYSGSCGEPNPAFDALLDAATQRFGEGRQEFLQALVGWWMNAGASAFHARMESFGCRDDQSQPAWEDVPQVERYVLEESVKFRNFDFFGFGVREYLSRQNHYLAFAVPLLLHGLSNPEPLVADTCFALLGKLAACAGPALPAMLDLTCERGPYFAPDQPMRSLAAVVDAHPEFVHLLVARLHQPSGRQTLQAISMVCTEMRRVPPPLFTALGEAFNAAQDSDQRYALFCGLATTAQRALVADAASPDDIAWARDSAAQLLQQSRQLAISEDAALRSAAAWGLARLGTPQHEQGLMLQLLRDPEWTPRSNASAALKDWPSPSPELVQAVGKLLGDDEGHDGYPHENALDTLIHWGERSAPALTSIQRWIDSADEGELLADKLLALVRALGPHASGLSAQVQAFLRRWDQNEAEEMNEGQAQQGHWLAAADVSDETSQLPTEMLAAMQEMTRLIDETAAEVEAANEQDFLAAQSDLVQEDGEEAVVDETATLCLARRLGIDRDEEIPGTRSSRELAEEPDSAELLRRWLQQHSGVPQT